MAFSQRPVSFQVLVGSKLNGYVVVLVFLYIF